ncbi:MAG: glycosyltransferase family 2 protein [Acidimicrobiaceae bacterium]|nr:glycosyltransferase family 2 protein [Acidimicrobiaceae bacterium]MYL04498.1 glycosyltransferase family 2 protein [Acidimicrobiaceae bacterium]
MPSQPGCPELPGRLSPGTICRCSVRSQVKASEPAASSVAVVRISVIIPTYNEADNIVEVIDRLRRALSDQSHEIIVVDDDSPDGTWQVARRHSEGDPAVRVIRRIGERGLATAVLDGMAAAEGDALAVMDGDLQHDEAALPAMVGAVLDGEADVCVGSRTGESGSFGDRSRLRHWLTAAGTALVERLLPRLRRTSDPLSGFFVVSRGLYERTAPRISRGLREYKILWAFLASRKDLSVTEVGYDFRPRGGGETKLSTAVLLDDLVSALVLRLGRVVSPLFVKYCLVGASGVAVSLAVYGLGELAGLPTVSLSITPDLNPIYISALLGIQASIITNFLANNFFTFYDRRYRRWGLLGGLLLFQAVSIVGVFVQLAVFQLLHRNGFPTSSTNADVAAAVNNGIGLAVATLTNFFLNVSITWNRARGSS